MHTTSVTMNTTNQRSGFFKVVPTSLIMPVLLLPLSQESAFHFQQRFPPPVLIGRYTPSFTLHFYMIPTSLDCCPSIHCGKHCWTATVGVHDPNVDAPNSKKRWGSGRGYECNMTSVRRPYWRYDPGMVQVFYITAINKKPCSESMSTKVSMKPANSWPFW